MTIPEEVIRQHGEPGSSIPGSKYMRAYCSGCRQPIRVASVTKDIHGRVLNSVCEDCWPLDVPTSCSIIRRKYYPVED